MKTMVMALLAGCAALSAQVVVEADVLYPMTGDLKPIKNGVVVCSADGKIAAVGKKGTLKYPPGHQVLTAAVAMPGVIDAYATVGLSGILNSDKHDQEQLDRSGPIQPELRAVDAYNGRDPLVKWLRDLGVTTVHAGHAPGALVAGQAMVIKTNVGSIVRDDDPMRPFSMVVASLGKGGWGGSKGKTAGTRAKALALLRAELLKARERMAKEEKAEEGKEPGPDLRLDTLVAVLRQEVPLLVNAHRHQDISAALRLRQEFGFNLVLSGAAEVHTLLDEVKEAGVPVIVHPTMARPYGDLENVSFTTAARLQEAGIPFAFQSGYESYVPKTRVVLFEAALAAAYGLPREAALAGCTVNAAKILGIDDRVGSLQAGLDADLALFDGDPLETVTHCVGVIIDGKVVSETAK